MVDILEPRIKINFYMSGNNLNLDIITKRIGIEPTKVRKRTEWPQASISAGIAKDTWLLQLNDEECKAVSIQLDKLQYLLFSKVPIIKELSKEYLLEVSVTVVIDMEKGDGPELVLSPSNIKFLSLINAEIGFDLYIN